MEVPQLPSRSARDAQPPSLLRLAFIFGRIGLTSFGGGLSGWLLREFVQDLKLLTEEEFLSGLSISQALPGVNVTNMAIWIGYHLRGRRGAIVGVLAIVVPPAVVIVLLGALFSRLTQFPTTHLALDGAAAAAIGLSLSMAIVMARRVRRALFPLAVGAATFLAIGIFHWPLLEVVLAGGAVSVAVEYIRSARI
jgi:chromate transporter